MNHLANWAKDWSRRGKYLEKQSNPAAFATIFRRPVCRREFCLHDGRSWLSPAPKL